MAAPNKITYYVLTPPAEYQFQWVAVMQLIDDSDLAEAVRKFSEVNFIPSAIREVAFAELPTNRFFRGAWVDNGTAVVVDMPKARAIHMGRIRIARDAALPALDTAYLLADETGDKKLKDSIAAQKQVLRDLPATFDLTGATSPEELHALWPSVLVQ